MKMVSRGLKLVLFLFFGSKFCVQAGSYGTFDVFKLGSNGQLNPVALNQELKPNPHKNHQFPYVNNQQRVPVQNTYPAQNSQFTYNSNQNQFPIRHENQVPNSQGSDIVIAVVDQNNNNNLDNVQQLSNFNTGSAYNSPYEVIVIEEQGPQITQMVIGNGDVSNKNPNTNPSLDHVIDDIFGNDKNKIHIANDKDSVEKTNDHINKDNTEKNIEDILNGGKDAETLLNENLEAVFGNNNSNDNNNKDTTLEDNLKDIFGNSENKNDSIQKANQNKEALLNANIEDIFGMENKVTNAEKGNRKFGNVPNGQGIDKVKSKTNQDSNFFDKDEEPLTVASTEYYSLTIPSRNRPSQYYNQYNSGYNFYNQGCNQYGCHPPPPPPPPSPWGPYHDYHGPHQGPPPPPPHGPPPHHGPPHGPPPPYGHPPYHGPPPPYGHPPYHGPPPPPPPPGRPYYQNPQNYGSPPPNPGGRPPPRGGVNPLSTDNESPGGNTITLITDDSSGTSKVEKGHLIDTSTTTAASTMTTPYTPDIDVRFGKDLNPDFVFPQD